MLRSVVCTRVLPLAASLLPGNHSPSFFVDVTDGGWHQFGFSVRGQTVTMFFDCLVELGAIPLHRSSISLIRTDTVLSVGSKFSSNDEMDLYQVGFLKLQGIHKVWVHGKKQIGCR